MRGDCLRGFGRFVGWLWGGAGGFLAPLDGAWEGVRVWPFDSAWFLLEDVAGFGRFFFVGVHVLFFPQSFQGFPEG